MRTFDLLVAILSVVGVGGAAFLIVRSQMKQAESDREMQAMLRPRGGKLELESHRTARKKALPFGRRKKPAEEADEEDAEES